MFRQPTPPGCSYSCATWRSAELLGQEVALAPDCVGDAVKQQIAALQNGQVLLLENVR